MVASIREQIIAELDYLTAEQQAALLGMARRLRRTLSADEIAARQAKLPPGTPMRVLIDHMDDFDFAPGEVDEMLKAIEEDCGRIDWDGWV